MMNGRNYSRSVPVQKPKVVSIPVHFVSSDHQKPQTNISTLKHKSALKIQKVFKGHTVRQSVKKIVSIKNEVNEIEKRLKNDVVFVKLLRKDAKERLRVNETLMSLLFKLDSVRGVDIGVRELRKSVAKKAVALQDKLDSIAQSHHDDVSNDGEDMKEEVVDNDVNKNDQNLESVEDHVIDDVSNKNGDQVELVVNEAMNEDSVKECDADVSNKDIDHELDVNEAMNEVKQCDDDVSSNVRNWESVEVEQDVKEAVENCVTDEGTMKECDDDVSKSCCDQGMVEDCVTDEGRMKECGGGVDDVSRRCCDKGMVEKLMCDNAKMMKLMIQISERNEMQTRMINSLSRRVEQLEKAFMSDKSRRRKKSSTRSLVAKLGFCKWGVGI